MPDHSAELALLGCVLLNAAVFGAAWRFAARRVTTSTTQAVLDAALLGYAVQYAAVGLPGVLGLLRPAVVVAVAITAAIALFAVAGRQRPTGRATAGVDRAVVIAAATFVTAVVLGFAYHQSGLPVAANDPLTYHFPAAVQWLQRGRIGLFPTWFFNPANGYSPLAGSAFVAWLMVPFGSDVMARFVQVPALLFTGLGVYRLARQVAPVAAEAATPVEPVRSGFPAVSQSVMAAAAAVLCRPLFMASLTGKDDLFVAFTFAAALVALAPDRAAEPFGALRLGLALGLLLATKYTAFLAVPMLLLAADGPWRGGWRPGRWLTAAATAVVVAGPWYLRNWIATGNPVFPLDVSPLFHGLFTAARSTVLASPAADVKAILGGSYGLPVAVAAVAASGWMVTAVGVGLWARDPMRRACVLGPPVGLAVFLWRSPFPEVRFVYPVLLALLAAAVAGLTGRLRWAAVALPLAAVATITVSRGWAALAPVIAVAAIAAVVVAWADSVTVVGPRWRRGAVVALPLCGLSLLAYVRWTAFCNGYPTQWTADGTLWAAQYPYEQPLWRFVNRHVPADATVAYADLYLVYPLQGPGLRRRIGYAPTRRSVRTPADLPWLGDHLSGEQLVRAADAATVANPDPAAWRDNLRRLGADYLVIGRVVPNYTPVEMTWAASDPRHFRPLYAGPAGRVFSVRLSD